MSQKYSVPMLCLWAASVVGVCWLSLMPTPPRPIDLDHIDLVEHALAYGWLALLALRAFKTRGPAITAAWSMVLLGAALEVGQHFVPGRYTSWSDMLANTAGVIIGIWIGERIKQYEYFDGLKRALGVKDQ